MTAPAAVLSWSSGKDCAHALHVCRRDGIADVRALLDAQAAALGLPLIAVSLPWPCSNAEYESRMARATADIAARGLTHIVFGDLFLEDIRAYREEKLAGSGLTPLFPLFGTPADTPRLAQEMMVSGLRARIVTCNPEKLDPAFAGRTWDRALLDDLPAGVDPCGENGEFHTVVTDSPEFAAPIPHARGETVMRDGFAYADVLLSDI